MTSKSLKSAIWLTLAVGATALAAGGPPPGKGGGGGDEETGVNNLSAPAIMVAGTAGTLPAGCGAGAWSDLAPPSGTPLTGYFVEGYYYVQKVHEWQAQCMTKEPNTVSVTGAWGDNLGGDAKLKAGSPIRVELVLWEADGLQGDGYNVVKLENTLDRLSAYGTLATEVGGVFEATAEPMTPVVHDGRAKLEITGDGFSVLVDPLTPEINATGRVVYGYNLRVPAPGAYVITYTMPSVTFAGCDVPDTCIAGGHTATMTINVGTGGGGGGGGKGKPTDPPGEGE